MLFAQLLTGFGLAGAAGLNAYIPLLFIALLGRFEVVTLKAPFDVLTHTAVIAVLAVLLLVELIVDKVPVVDHVNDVIQTFIRPAAGALLFAGASGAIGDVPPVLLVVAGLLTAFGVHASKAAARPVANVSSGGFAAPVVSVLEDIASVVMTLVAIFLPLLVLVVAAIMGWAGVKLWRRVRRQRAV